VAAAVSAAVLMPVGAQADMTVYGRVNNALVLEDKGGMNDSTADIGTVGSRFGVKASSDLGNGLTAHGRYEFATNTDDSADGIKSTRIATAGISGGFGRVDVGNQWTAFYNSVGVDLDPTFAVGPVGSPTPFRSPNTIKYSNSVGPLALEVDLRLGDEGDEGGLAGNGGAIGIRVAATDNITLAAAYDVDDQTDIVVTPGLPKRPGLNKDDDGNVIDADGVVILPATHDEMGNDHSRTGLSAKVSLDQFWGALGWSSHEAEDANGMTKADKEHVAGYVGMSFNDSTSGWLGYSQQEAEGTAAEPSKIAAGLYHNMGGGLRFWYEGGSTDLDEPGKDDQVKHWIGIRYDF